MAEIVIDLNDAATQLPELVRRAALGDDVILTVAGEPVANIVPAARPAGRRQFGRKGSIHVADDFDGPVFDESALADWNRSEEDAAWEHLQ